MFLVCFGNISYWKNYISAKHSTLYINHTFQKQTSLSQYEIQTSNGRLKLSVPVVKATRRGTYRDVKISYDENWNLVHWRSIESAYLKSPFFMYYSDKLKALFETKYEYLWQFNQAVFETILTILKVKDKTETNEIEAVNYHEIEKTLIKDYPQVFDDRFDFMSDLSILDLVFNLGPECFDYLDAAG